jgi:hypothetical protein
MRRCKRQNRMDVARRASSWIAGSIPAMTGGEGAHHGVLIGVGDLGFVPPKSFPLFPRVRFAKMLATATAGLAIIMGELHRSGGACARSPLGNVPPHRGGKAPTGAVRIAAPWPPCGWACPSGGRERPVRNADRRAYRRLAAAFSLDLETAFWKRTGAPFTESP